MGEERQPLFFRDFFFRYDDVQRAAHPPTSLALNIFEPLAQAAQASGCASRWAGETIYRFSRRARPLPFIPPSPLPDSHPLLNSRARQLDFIRQAPLGEAWWRFAVPFVPACTLRMRAMWDLR